MLFFVLRKEERGYFNKCKPRMLREIYSKHFTLETLQRYSVLSGKVNIRDVVCELIIMG
jgi:hypothetical protein